MRGSCLQVKLFAGYKGIHVPWWLISPYGLAAQTTSRDRLVFLYSTIYHFFLNVLYPDLLHVSLASELQLEKTSSARDA